MKTEASNSGNNGHHNSEERTASANGVPYRPANGEKRALVMAISPSSTAAVAEMEKFGASNKKLRLDLDANRSEKNDPIEQHSDTTASKQFSESHTLMDTGTTAIEKSEPMKNEKVDQDTTKTAEAQSTKATSADDCRVADPFPPKKVKVGKATVVPITNPSTGMSSPSTDLQSAQSTTVYNNNNKKRSKKNKHMDPRILEIRRRIQLSCRDDELESAMVAYEEAIANDIEIEAQSYYNILNLCGGLGKSQIHVGTPKFSALSPAARTSAREDIDHNQKRLEQGNDQWKDINRDDCVNDAKQVSSKPFELNERLEYAFRIKRRMAEQNVALNEAGYSAIMKLLSKNKQFDQAEELLDEAESVKQCKPKLRLYSSLLTAYCDDSKMLKALKIWKRLRGHEGLGLTEREYLWLMRCAIMTGNSMVMEFVLTELAEEVPVPCKDTVAAMIEWFGSTHSKHTESLTQRQADSDSVQEVLNDIAKSDSSERPPSMGPVVCKNGWQISSACSVEKGTGKLTKGCLEGHYLQPVPLSDRAFRDMLQMNESIVFEGKIAGNDCQFQGGRKGKKRNDFSPESRRQEWKCFIDFLERKENESGTGTSFDVVIDGANIGYHQQNFSDAPAHVNYNQIDWVVRHFCKVKKQNVLLVMHSRHFTHSMLTEKYQPLYESWMKDRILYKTPFGMNDDWFWMHAALKCRLLVVTNDEMRDHHFQMLAPRSFLRWKERHQVRFGFGSWEEGCRRQVLLEYPDEYSRRIQRVNDGLVVPLAKRGDDSRYLDGSHFASEDEPNEETCLCIRPKRCTSKEEVLVDDET